MEYPMWLFFAIWFITSTMASKEWVQIPVIGHRPKGTDEKKVEASKPNASTLRISTSSSKPSLSFSKTTQSPPTTPLTFPKVTLKTTKTVPQTTQHINVPEDTDPLESKTDPGLPVDEFMRAHETLSQYGKGSVIEKVNFLGHLKKQLLRKAAELMPRAIIALGVRSPASSSEGRGHKGIGFPSSEGTLMSLCFLVFAVFLVKIVMQLIQGLQNNSLGVVTGAARSTRSNWEKVQSEEELLRLLENLQHHRRAWSQH